MRLMTTIASALLLAIGGPAATASPTPRQAAYDAAQAAYDKSDWQAAAIGFSALLPADPNRPLGRSSAVIAIRLADAQRHLDRFEEATANAQRGLAVLPDDDPTDLGLGWAIIGEDARRLLDYDAAHAAYGRSIVFATRSGDLTVRMLSLVGDSIVLATRDPVAATGPLDAVLADKELRAGIDKPSHATLEELRSRAALNAGDLPAAKTWADRALADSGGLGTQVTPVQVAIRGDAAIVAQRRHDDESARLYLAYTGAGHLRSSDWIGKAEGSPPVCAEGGQVRSDDFAVVQFDIAADGHVRSVTPIYASRPGDVGLAFARAALGWRWDPFAIKSVPEFWLSTLRLELRCETRPEPESLGIPIATAARAWFATRGGSGEEESYVGPHDPRLAHDDVAAIPAMLRRMSVSSADWTLYGPRVAHILDEAGAPPEARALLVYAWARKPDGSPGFRQAARTEAAALAGSVPAFAKAYPGSPAAAWLRLEWAIAVERTGDFAGAKPLLDRVLETPPAVLRADDPLRQVATLHLAVVRRQLGDPAGANAAIRAAGLDSERCALVDTRPVPTNLSIVSSQFPSDALRWRFEGYVQVGYDINADGTVANVRSIIAYPPFVFDQGTERAAQRFRYVPPTIDGRPVGCTGAMQSVRYRIPQR